ncbi:MAG TPA: hypothetical protein VLT32_11285, partial [Candidatus Sulfomarinibacteraceae bacterium]|nr:hypothetical protein [Candidatus Sulfomarinibacteraceae bacterium]
MTRRRKWLLALGATMVVVCAAVVAVVHAPSVQEAVFRRAAAAIEHETGWSLTAESVSLRAFPARLSARGLVLSTGGRAVLSVDAIEARWRWRGLLAEPRRIESLVVEGPTLDLEALPTAEAGAAPSELDPWRALEIGSLRLRGGVVSGGALDLDVEVGGLELGGSLVGGRAEVAITADRVALMRLTRALDLGRLELEAAADRGGVAVQRLSLAGAATTLDLVGELATDGGPNGAFEVEIEADVPVVAEWWDPNLVSGLSPEGRLDLVGSVAMAAGSGLEADLEHRGAPLRVAGYELDELRIGYQSGRPTLAAAGPGWGRAAVEIAADGVTEVSATLEQAPVDRLLAFVAPQAAQLLTGEAVVSGELEARVPFPVDIEDLEGRVDLKLQWADGELAVAGSGAGREWRVGRFGARAAGVRVEGSGSIDAAGRIDSTLEIEVPRPAETVAALRLLLPKTVLPAVGGGAITARAALAGELVEPRLTAEVSWERPEIAGRRTQTARLAAEGDVAQLRWSVDLDVTEGTVASARGTARPLEAAVEGSWRVSVDDVRKLVDWAAPELELAPRGEVEAEGTLVFEDGEPRVTGTVAAHGLGVQDWVIESLRFGFEADPHVAVVRDIRLEG